MSEKSERKNNESQFNMMTVRMSANTVHQKKAGELKILRGTWTQSPDLNPA